MTSRVPLSHTHAQCVTHLSLDSGLSDKGLEDARVRVLRVPEVQDLCNTATTSNLRQRDQRRQHLLLHQICE